MEANTKEYIDILIASEPIIKKAGELALKLRTTTKSSNKLQTGIAGIDIVTEADLEVQEYILSKLAKTKLVECQIIAEEDTPSAKKFKDKNGLTLTLDPIDGTLFYATNKRFFSVIICLRKDKQMLYTFNYYPVLKWGYGIADKKVLEFGKRPKVKVYNKINLDKVIVHTFADPENSTPQIYKELTGKGYVFKKMSEVTDESGSSILFYLNQVGGYFTNNPGAYDGLAMMQYGQVKNLKIYSDIDISKSVKGSRGEYCPGWYLVLRK